LDVTTQNVGPNFQGHDIIAVFEAIKKSPEVREKGEFETTAAFDTRRSGFSNHPLIGTTTPGDHFGFLLATAPASMPESKFDADTQTLSIILRGARIDFLAPYHKLDAVLVRSPNYDRSTYVASNAFGAKATVTELYGQAYGLAFDLDSWVFRASPSDARELTYTMKMSSDEARVLKPDLKIILVCRLSEPWLRTSAHGHDATIDDPYKVLVGDNYLQVIPEQVWILNGRTGQVITKLSEATFTTEKGLFALDVSTTRGVFSYKALIDDVGEKSGMLSSSTTFFAKRRIVLTFDAPTALSAVRMKLNDKSYEPHWDIVTIPGTDAITSATAVVTVP